jgi:hypothetical protein
MMMPFQGECGNQPFEEFVRTTVAAKQREALHVVRLAVGIQGVKDEVMP